jgi:hypothetical protein
LHGTAKVLARGANGSCDRAYAAILEAMSGSGV